MIKLKKGEIINLLDKFDYYMMKGEINHVTTKQIYQNNKYLYYHHDDCLLYTSPSPRDAHESRMPSSA